MTNACGQNLSPKQRVDCCRLPVACSAEKCNLLKEYFACDNNNNKIIIIIKTILIKEYFACDNLRLHTFMWSLVRTSLMPATF